MSEEKQIEEMTCEKCLHYEMCLEKFRNAKKDGFCEFVDEEEYFSHADECDFFVTGYRKQSEVLDDLEDLLIDFDEMGFCPRTTVPDPEGYAVEWKRKLVNALQGYRKQSEGEWITDEEGYVTCSNCGEEHTWDEFRPPYCDMCGARMKGGAE